MWYPGKFRNVVRGALQGHLADLVGGLSTSPREFQSRLRTAKRRSANFECAQLVHLPEAHVAMVQGLLTGPRGSLLAITIGYVSTEDATCNTWVQTNFGGEIPYATLFDAGITRETERVAFSLGSDWVEILTTANDVSPDDVAMASIPENTEQVARAAPRRSLRSKRSISLQEAQATLSSRYTNEVEELLERASSAAGGQVTFKALHALLAATEHGGLSPIQDKSDVQRALSYALRSALKDGRSEVTVGDLHSGMSLALDR